MDLVILILIFIISTLLHYSIQKVFIYYKKFDDFNHRSSHKTLATRTGGIGIFLTLLIISLFYYFQNVQVFDYSLFIPIGIMFIVGVYDDFYHADFKLKFFLQIIVAKILIDQGYVISNFHGFLGLDEVPWLIAQISTIFVFLIIVNAINFIDGIDGLAITEVIKTILIIEFFSSEVTILWSLSLITISSILPLYYFNFKKRAKVFLGDGGSLLLGTLVATYVFLILGDNFKFSEDFELNKTLFAILVITFPLFDLLRVFLIRMKNGKSPFEPDQNHIHHIFLKYFKKNISALSILILFILVVELTFIYFGVQYVS